MKITEELQKKINHTAASNYLSEGTYEDLEAAASGDEEAEGRIIIWDRFENDSIDYVFEKVSDLADSIADLFINS